MIHMPHRSVTRFFVPLIDVLLLLFCIFLLMPLADETELDSSRAQSAELSEENQMMSLKMEGTIKELEKYAENLPRLKEIAELQEELERLRKIERQNLQQKYDFQIIDIDGATGDIYYYDTTLPAAKARKPIASEKDAKELIERQKAKAGGRKVYYHFLYPRPRAGFPTREDVIRYKEWFDGAETSLK